MDDGAIVSTHRDGLASLDLEFTIKAFSSGVVMIQADRTTISFHTQINAVLVLSATFDMNDSSIGTILEPEFLLEPIPVLRPLFIRPWHCPRWIGMNVIKGSACACERTKLCQLGNLRLDIESDKAATFQHSNRIVSRE